MLIDPLRLNDEIKRPCICPDDALRRRRRGATHIELAVTSELWDRPELCSELRLGEQDARYRPAVHVGYSD